MSMMSEIHAAMTADGVLPGLDTAELDALTLKYADVVRAGKLQATRGVATYIGRCPRCRAGVSKVATLDEIRVCGYQERSECCGRWGGADES